MPIPSIPAGNKYMDVSLWTGNGSSTVTVTNNGSFQPGFVWAKQRNIAQQNTLMDSVRGPGYILASDTTTTDYTATTYGQLTSFDSNGFTASKGTDATYSFFNQNTGTYIGWQWKAGGTAVSNTAGTITSQVSANTTSGFSVATFTSPASGSFTFGHGLGVAPKMVITKIRNATDGWQVWHTALGGTQYLQLNTTAAVTTNANIFSSAPTSTVVNMGSNPTPSYNLVAYCWSEVAGYSKFGSYTANGSTDGPFIYCGFRPRWIMFKRTTSATNWYIVDTSISPYNAGTDGLYPNTSGAQSTEGAMDILSNGFKLRSASGAFNFPSSETFIYAAFAENPFKYALAR